MHRWISRYAKITRSPLELLRKDKPKAVKSDEVAALMLVPGPSTDSRCKVTKRRKAVMSDVNYAVGRELAVLRYFQWLLKRRPNMLRSWLAYVFQKMLTLKKVVHSNHATPSCHQCQLQHLWQYGVSQMELNGGNAAPINVNDRRDNGWYKPGGIR